jgi:O-antigen biosynthesis protein WbqV
MYCTRSAAACLNSEKVVHANAIHTFLDGGGGAVQTRQQWLRGRRMKPVPFNIRIATVATHDVVMAGLSFELSLAIRYGLQDAVQPIGFLWIGTLLFTTVCGLVFWRSVLYRGIWHYASINDLLAIVRSVTVAVAVFLPVLFVLTRLEAYPRSAIVINWALLILMLTVPRFIYRALKDGNFRAVFERPQSGNVPTLVVGARDTAEAFIREMARSKTSPYRVVGIVDDRPGRFGRDIRGVRVLGAISELGAVVADLEAKGKRPHRIILASDSLDGSAVR